MKSSRHVSRRCDSVPTDPLGKLHIVRLKVDLGEFVHSHHVFLPSILKRGNLPLENRGSFCLILFHRESQFQDHRNFFICAHRIGLPGSQRPLPRSSSWERERSLSRTWNGRSWHSENLFEENELYCHTGTYSVQYFITFFQIQYPQRTK